jgi:hypothetical protein
MGTLSIPTVTHVPSPPPIPREVDANSLQTAMNTISQHANMMEDRIRVLMDQQGKYNRSLDDLWHLVNFLEHNPGATIHEWARYERVKECIEKSLDKEKSNVPF